MGFDLTSVAARSAGASIFLATTIALTAAGVLKKHLGVPDSGVGLTARVVTSVLMVHVLAGTACRMIAVAQRKLGGRLARQEALRFQPLDGTTGPGAAVDLHGVKLFLLHRTGRLGGLGTWSGSTLRAIHAYTLSRQFIE